MMYKLPILCERKIYNPLQELFPKEGEEYTNNKIEYAITYQYVDLRDTRRVYWRDTKHWENRTRFSCTVVVNSNNKQLWINLPLREVMKLIGFRKFKDYSI